MWHSTLLQEELGRRSEVSAAQASELQDREENIGRLQTEAAKLRAELQWV